MGLCRVESWAEAHGTEAREGWREPVYHCALTQGWKEQSQGIPYGKGRQAGNELVPGVGESEANQTLSLTQTGSLDTALPPSQGLPGRRREHQAAADHLPFLH